MRVCLLLGICLLFFSTSCVPHKDIVYYQNKEKALDSTQVLTEKQGPYRIQIGDILNIRVKALDQENVQILNPIGNENLNASAESQAFFDGFSVDVHGNIRMPTLGEINVLGRTTEEIEHMLEQKLLDEQFKETANIFVSVKLTGIRYTASGEVGSPGTKTLYQNSVNIYEALANVGEISDFGDRKDVLIIRQYPQGQKIHHLDLTDVDVMNSPYYYIQPNDMIYVKPLKKKVIGSGRTFVESLGTVASILSLAATTILIITRL